MNSFNFVLAGWIGQWEILVILVIALLIFGKRLPEIAKSVGKSLTAFKKGLNDVDDDTQKNDTNSDIKKNDSSNPKE